MLQDRLNLVKQKPLDYKLQPAELAWEALNKSTPEDFEISYDTGVPIKTLDKVVKHLISYPEGFTPLKKVDRMLQQRRKAFFEDDIVDWASWRIIGLWFFIIGRF